MSGYMETRDYELLTVNVQRVNFKSELRDLVLEGTKQGWEPLGAPFVINKGGSDHILVAQAMVFKQEA